MIRNAARCRPCGNLPGRASGGYVLTAAATDHRIKAVGTVSAVDIARQFRLGADGTQDPAIYQSMLDAAAAARTAEAIGDGVQTFKPFPVTVEEAHAMGGRHAADGFEYYRTPRGEHPRSGRFLPWTSIDHKEQHVGPAVEKLTAFYETRLSPPFIAQDPAAQGPVTRRPSTGVLALAPQHTDQGG